MSELETVLSVSDINSMCFCGDFYFKPSFVGVNTSVEWEKSEYELHNERVVERMFSIDEFSKIVFLSDVDDVLEDICFHPLTSKLLVGGSCVRETSNMVFYNVQDLIRVYSAVVQLKRYEKEISHRVVSDAAEDYIERINRKINSKRGEIDELSGRKADSELVVNKQNIDKIINVKNDSSD